MKTNRKTARAFLGAALLSAALAAGVTPARAQVPPAGGTKTTARPVGRAEAQVVEASIASQRVALGEATAESALQDGRPAVSAVGLGASPLTEQTKSVAGSGDAGVGGRRCATPAEPAGPTAVVLGAVPGAVPNGLSEDPLRSVLDVGAACGDARASGGGDGFIAESTGQVVTAEVKAPAAQGLLGSVLPGLGVAGPSGLPGTDVVAGLLDRLRPGPVARLTLGTATARSAGDASSYLSRAVTDGGTIDVLPGLLGQETTPLLRISVTPSAAEVGVDRPGRRAVARVTNPVVRLESPVLRSLGLTGLTGPAADSDSIEVAPGQRVSVLCQGVTAPLCTEIAVGNPGAPVTTGDGRTAVAAAPVSIRLLESSGVHLTFGRARAEAASVNAATTPDVPAHSGRVNAAEIAGGGGTPAEPAPAGTTPSAAAAAAAPLRAGMLPRTGGLPVSPAPIPVALLTGAGLWTLARGRGALPRRVAVRGH